MKPITLYKGNSSYLCETEARLEKFKAAGWSTTKPAAKKAKDPDDGKKDEGKTDSET